MFDQQPTLELLFEQLGLAADEESIDQFINQNQLKPGEMMHEASFWTQSQRQFIVSHWQQDDEWAIVVDTLNELLSRDVKKKG